MCPYFPPSVSLYQCLKHQIKSFKDKTIYIFRDQNLQSLRELLSVYTVRNATFPPAATNYTLLSIMMLIPLILATKWKRPLRQAWLDALRLQLLMSNRWLISTCYYLPTPTPPPKKKKITWKSFINLLDERGKIHVAKPGPFKYEQNYIIHTC